MGALGGRFDHMIASINQLFKRDRMYLLDGINLVFLLREVTIGSIAVLIVGDSLYPQWRIETCMWSCADSICYNFNARAVLEFKLINETSRMMFLDKSRCEFGGLISTSNQITAECAEVEVHEGSIVFSVDLTET